VAQRVTERKHLIAILQAQRAAAAAAAAVSMQHVAQRSTEGTDFISILQVAGEQQHQQ
jgi:hypothetical protein